DGWNRVTRARGRRIVLLSSLNPQKYYATGDFFFSVLDALCALVARHAGWELVVKCKGQRDMSAVAERVQGRDGVTVVADVALHDVLSGASVIVGANSLSIVEGLLSDATLFVPLDGAVHEPDTLMFDAADPLVAQCLNFVGSTDDLVRRIAAIIEGAPEP